MRLKSGETVNYKFEDNRLALNQPNMLTYVFEIVEERGEKRENGERVIRPSFFLNGERMKVKEWSVNDTVKSEEPGFVGPVDTWNEGEIVGVGGYLHRSGSATGIIDNVLLFDHAMTEEEIRTLYEQKGQPENIAQTVGFFDFEGEPDTDGRFISTGSNKFKGGIHTYRDTEVEGQGMIIWKSPEIVTIPNSF